jgi:dTDP-4-amino-4,6-dideoxygalactose transaminase
VVEIDEKATGVSRDRIMALLHAENVRVRRYFYPGCHRMEPYHTYYPNAGLLLPETERISEKVLCFPTGATLKRQDIEKICQLTGFVLDHAGEVI